MKTQCSTARPDQQIWRISVNSVEDICILVCSFWMSICPHWSGALREKRFGGPRLRVLTFPLGIRQLWLSIALKCSVWNQQTSWPEHKHSAFKSIIIISPQGCISFVSEAWWDACQTNTHLQTVACVTNCFVEI